MSMSNAVPSVGPMFPEIAASELKAVRDFLTSFRDEQPAPPRPSRPFARPGDRKPPTVSNGITRARLRSTSKLAD